MLLRSILFLGILAGGQTVSHSAGPAALGRAAPAGTYVARAFNRKPLPAQIRIVTTNGYYHWVKLDEAILRLSPDGRFTVSFKYYHEHLPGTQRPAPSPLLLDSRRGTYSISGNSITFVAEQSKKANPTRPLTGTIRGDEIEVHYEVREGQGMRDLVIVLERDPTYWSETASVAVHSSCCNHRSYREPVEMTTSAPSRAACLRAPG